MCYISGPNRYPAPGPDSQGNTWGGSGPGNNGPNGPRNNGPSGPGNNGPNGPGNNGPNGPGNNGPNGPGSNGPNGPWNRPGWTGPPNQGNNGPPNIGPTGPPNMGPTGPPNMGPNGPPNMGPNGPPNMGPNGPPSNMGPCGPPNMRPPFNGPDCNVPNSPPNRGPDGPWCGGPNGPNNKGPNGPWNNSQQSKGPWNNGPNGPANRGPDGNWDNGSNGPPNRGPSGPWNNGPQNQGPCGPWNNGPNGPPNQGPSGPWNNGPNGPPNQGDSGPWNNGPPNQGPGGPWNSGQQNRGNSGQWNNGSNVPPSGPPNIQPNGPPSIPPNGPPSIPPNGPPNTQPSGPWNQQNQTWNNSGPPNQRSDGPWNNGGNGPPNRGPGGSWGNEGSGPVDKWNKPAGETCDNESGRGENSRWNRAREETWSQESDEGNSRGRTWEDRERREPESHRDNRYRSDRTSDRESDDQWRRSEDSSHRRPQRNARGDDERRWNEPRERQEGRVGDKTRPREDRRGEREDRRGQQPWEDRRGQHPREDRRGQQPREDRRGQQPREDRRGERPRDDQRGERPRDDQRGERRREWDDDRRRGRDNRPPREQHDDFQRSRDSHRSAGSSQEWPPQSSGEERGGACELPGNRTEPAVDSDCESGELRSPKEEFPDVPEGGAAVQEDERGRGTWQDGNRSRDNRSRDNRSRDNRSYQDEERPRWRDQDRRNPRYDNRQGTKYDSQERGNRRFDRVRNERSNSPFSPSKQSGSSRRSRSPSSFDRSSQRSKRSRSPLNRDRRGDRRRSRSPDSKRSRLQSDVGGGGTGGDSRDKIPLELPGHDIASGSQSPSIVSDEQNQEAGRDEEAEQVKILEPEYVEPAWVRSTPAEVYFKPDGDGKVRATKRQVDMEDRFEDELVKRASKVRSTNPKYERPPRKVSARALFHFSDQDSSDSDHEEDITDDINESIIEELELKKKHPERLHEELWFNEPGEQNDGPVCRCSAKSRGFGIRHNIYPGEEPFPKCDPSTNNAGKLYHYRITMSPVTNFLVKNPTTIEYDNHEYIFEGFSLFSHYKLENIPICEVIRFNIEYTIHFFEEDMPTNFDIRSLDLFSDYIFEELLELYDLQWKEEGEGCRRFHLMPRFGRCLPDNGLELLSMNEVLRFLLTNNQPLIDPTELNDLQKHSKPEWNDYVDLVRGMLVTKPGMRPAGVRVDQLDRSEEGKFPHIIHFGFRPSQLSFIGNKEYQKMWREFMKHKHLLTLKGKPTADEKQKLKAKEEQLQNIRLKTTMRREVTSELSSEGFYKTGIKADVSQHALLLPVLIAHLRFHNSLHHLQTQLGYQFQDPYLVQIALTHPSYRVSYGTNADHARNSLFNCGIRQPEYGTRWTLLKHTKKRGIVTLLNIMSKMPEPHEVKSPIFHYERLEFLGDAVVEIITTIHLYFMFPDLSEGGLATYRAAIVQNQHLTVLAQTLGLEKYVLYGHGPDLCHDMEFKHALANCMESLMGALYLDGGMDVADRIFSSTLFHDDPNLQDVWVNLPKHPLQAEEPDGDRHWIAESPVLQKLTKFEQETGITFNHMRLLARAFTMRNVGPTILTHGSNQRLEFLGDSVLQLVCSVQLYKHFPYHHEGHLSILRSALVNNKTQALISDELDLPTYIISLADTERRKLNYKERADILEAVLGALFVDKDIDYVTTFCEVCFFPRLEEFILHFDWDDPKSQLQHCCLALRNPEGEDEPSLPVYKILEVSGPTNTRQYTVAVYFQDERLATGVGHSIQQAEMGAAANALVEKEGMFPLLGYQRRFYFNKFGHYLSLENRYKIQRETNEDELARRNLGKNDRQANKILLQTMVRSRTQRGRGRGRGGRGRGGGRGREEYREYRARSRDRERSVGRRPRGEGEAATRGKEVTSWAGERAALQRGGEGYRGKEGGGD